MIKLKNIVQEGFLDMFRKRKVKVDSKPINKYNKNDVGYGHPDFEKEHRGFAKDPEAEITDASHELFKLNKPTEKLLSAMILEHQHILEMMTQQDMVNGNGSNKFFISQTKEFIDQLEDTEFKIRKGIW